MDIPNHLVPKQLRIANAARGAFVIVVAPGVTPEMVANPDFWRSTAESLRPLDQIEVIAEDHSFDMLVRVVAVDDYKHYAQVKVLWLARGDGIDLGQPRVTVRSNDGYLIEQDPVHGWRLLHGRDEIGRHFDSREAAMAARDAHKAGRPVKSRAA